MRLKNIEKIRNYFIKEKKANDQNELMSNRHHKKVCTTLHYMKHFLRLASAVTGCTSLV